jgi:ribosomal RNA-processing protein 9
MKRRVAIKRGTTAQPQRKKRALGDDAFDWGKGDSNDVIASDSEASEENSAAESEEDEKEQKETAQEKRLRLAKEYLGKITAQEAGTDDEQASEDGDGVEQRVGDRLKQDALEAMGKLFKKVAVDYSEFEFDTDSTKFLKGHRLPVTSLCLLEDGKTAFSAAKDGSLLRWDLAQQKKTKLTLPKDDVAAEKTKTDQDRCILALAASSDGKFLASGGRDKLVRVWDAEKGELQESFSGHRDAVSALAFRLRSHSLFSGSLDRSIKHWNLTEMGYIETLFGHQSEVNGLDSLYKERVVSCGRDRSVRMWKIPEETQLVFYGNSGSMDCVKMVTDEYYVTGGDDGSLSLWFNGRKKPVCVIPNAHGGKWISSIAVMPRTDLVASGSSDGQIRLWQADLQGRSLTPVATIPLEGFVNGLCFDPKARFLLAGVGQEHRLGRWEKLKVKNGIAIIALPSKDGEQEQGDDDEEEEEEAESDDES